MSRSNDRQPSDAPRTAFGVALSEQLDRANLSQTALAEATGTSPSYVNQTMSGKKPVGPQWADMVADVLGVSDRERVRLHRAAASDAGFKLDLTKKG